jgi:hypothetical protein
MNTINNQITIRRRGRPAGVKNSLTIAEHEQKLINRKKSMQANFQRYKEANHEELKQVYKDHYYDNRERKLRRVNELYRLNFHIKQLMRLDSVIMA